MVDISSSLFVSLFLSSLLVKIRQLILLIFFSNKTKIVLFSLLAKWRWPDPSSLLPAKRGWPGLFHLYFEQRGDNLISSPSLLEKRSDLVFMCRWLFPSYLTFLSIRLRGKRAIVVAQNLFWVKPKFAWPSSLELARIHPIISSLRRSPLNITVTKPPLSHNNHGGNYFIL